VSKAMQIRTCLGCSARAPQRALLRLALDATGAAVPDPGRRAGGRGGYLHRDTLCWERFATRKGPVRSLRRTLSRSERQAVVARLQGDSEL